MVIGKGLVASAFDSYKSNNDFVIFASGVSNSKMTLAKEYEREENLLKETIKNNPGKTLVYFSTCSVYDPEETQSPYILYKKKTENYIRESCKSYYIFRVSNLVGKSENPNTILNFLVFHIQKSINFNLWINASRNLLDVEDLYTIADTILQSKKLENQIINIANPENYTVLNIVKEIELHLGKHANYIPVTKGAGFSIDTTAIRDILESVEFNFGKNYLVNLLKKYYPQK